MAYVLLLLQSSCKVFLLVVSLKKTRILATRLWRFLFSCDKRIVKLQYHCEGYYPTHSSPRLTAQFSFRDVSVTKLPTHSTVLETTKGSTSYGQTSLHRQSMGALTLIFVLMIWLETSTTACFNNTDCNRADEKYEKCCNGTCLGSCIDQSVKCQSDRDCATGQKCCDSGECISQVSLCSLSSKLAVAIPFSLLFFFAVVVCVCSNHSSCPVYKSNQRRHIGAV